MSEENFINILIAEDNEVTRDMMTGVLQAQGFNVFEAVDGESAITVIEQHEIDLALVDINMSPKGGLEFARHVLAQNLKIPIVIVTGDDSADLLVETSALGVARVLQKPVQPERLIQTVERILKRKGLNPSPLAVSAHDTRYSADELMKQAIELAAQNAQRGRGGPYAALVTDKEGRVLGTGVSGKAARTDPIAHAEVMAIRKAVEKLGQDDLSGCVLYCSSQPTRVGAALIAGVGILEVYYGLSHEDTGAITPHKKSADPVYKQLSHDAALEMFKSSQGSK